MIREIEYQAENKKKAYWYADPAKPNEERWHEDPPAVLTNSPKSGKPNFIRSKNLNHVEEDHVEEGHVQGDQDH